MTTQRKYDIHSDPENVVCAKFGCGKHLSLIEQLAGKYCTAHRGYQRVIGRGKPVLENVIREIINSKFK